MKYFLSLLIAVTFYSCKQDQKEIDHETKDLTEYSFLPKDCDWLVMATPQRFVSELFKLDFDKLELNGGGQSPPIKDYLALLGFIDFKSPIISFFKEDKNVMGLHVPIVDSAKYVAFLEENFGVDYVLFNGKKTAKSNDNIGGERFYSQWSESFAVIVFCPTFLSKNNTVEQYFNSSNFVDIHSLPVLDQNHLVSYQINLEDSISAIKGLILKGNIQLTDSSIILEDRFFIDQQPVDFFRDDVTQEVKNGLISYKVSLKNAIKQEIVQLVNLKSIQIGDFLEGWNGNIEGAFMGTDMIQQKYTKEVFDEETFESKSVVAYRKKEYFNIYAKVGFESNAAAKGVIKYLSDNKLLIKDQDAYTALDADYKLNKVFLKGNQIEVISPSKSDRKTAIKNGLFVHVEAKALHYLNRRLVPKEFLVYVDFIKRNVQSIEVRDIDNGIRAEIHFNKSFTELINKVW